MFGALVMSVINGCGAQGPEADAESRFGELGVPMDGGNEFSDEEIRLYKLAAEYQFLFPADGPLVTVDQVQEIVDQYESGLGQVAQAWHSAEFFGTKGTSDIPCFAGDPPNTPNPGQSANSKCWFPTYLSAKITAGGACRGNGLSNAYNDAAWSGFIEAIYDVDLLPEVVLSVNGFHSNISPNHLNVTASCTGLGGDLINDYGDLAQTEQAHPINQPRQSKLGRGPTTLVDEEGAYQYSTVDLKMDPVNIWMSMDAAGARRRNGLRCATFVDGFTDAVEIQNAARYAGVHETLHMLGWGHFVNGIMNPFGDCQHLNSINDAQNAVPIQFRDAWATYSGGFQTSNGTIHDVGVGDLNADEFGSLNPNNNL